MSDPITTGLTALQAAVGAMRFILESKSAFVKAEYQAKMAEAYGALVDAQTKLVEAKTLLMQKDEEIRKRDEIIRTLTEQKNTSEQMVFEDVITSRSPTAAKMVLSAPHAGTTSARRSGSMATTTGRGPVPFAATKSLTRAGTRVVGTSPLSRSGQTGTADRGTAGRTAQICSRTAWDVSVVQFYGLSVFGLLFGLFRRDRCRPADPDID